jgi:hypothetical protein
MTTPAKPANEARPAKDMTGYIALNERRTKETQPHWRGKVLIGGKEYLLSLWDKDANLKSLAVTDPATMPPRPDQGAQAQHGQAQQGARGPAAPAGQGAAVAAQGYPSASAQPPVGGDPFGDIFADQ